MATTKTISTLERARDAFVDIRSALETKTGSSFEDIPVESYDDAIENISANLGSKNIVNNGTYLASSDNLDGYDEVIVEVPIGTKTITENGTYNASSDDKVGYSQVQVNVTSPAQIPSICSIPVYDQNGVVVDYTYDTVIPISNSDTAVNIDTKNGYCNIDDNVALILINGYVYRSFKLPNGQMIFLDAFQIDGASGISFSSEGSNLSVYDKKVWLVTGNNGFDQRLVYIDIDNESQTYGEVIEKGKTGFYSAYCDAGSAVVTGGYLYINNRNVGDGGVCKVSLSVINGSYEPTREERPKVVDGTSKVIRTIFKDNKLYYFNTDNNLYLVDLVNESATTINNAGHKTGNNFYSVVDFNNKVLICGDDLINITNGVKSTEHALFGGTTDQYYYVSCDSNYIGTQLYSINIIDDDPDFTRIIQATSSTPGLVTNIVIPYDMISSVTVATSDGSSPTIDHHQADGYSIYTFGVGVKFVIYTSTAIVAFNIIDDYIYVLSGMRLNHSVIQTTGSIDISSYSYLFLERS